MSASRRSVVLRRVRRRSLWCCWIAVLAAGYGFAADLQWQEEANCRWATLPAASGGHTGFTSVPGEVSGIRFTNHLADRTVAYNRIYENGSGVALGDVDGDGRCDIYFCQLEGPNALYRNLGDWRFEDITTQSGVSCPNQFSTGAVFADIDGDRDLDLLVNAVGGGTRAFLNDGKAKFQELTGTRLVRRFGSTSLALADMDADGDLDLYVTNYRTDTYKDRPRGLKVEASMVDGKIVVSPPGRFIPIMPRGAAVEVIELGERDFLYLNDGQGRFGPVSWTNGAFLDEDGKPLTGPPQDWGLTVAFRDLNGDGTPDLYVCNDFFYSRDQVWFNQDSRGFRAINRTAVRNMSMSSMAMDVADINRDGYDDFIVLDMLSRNHSNRQRQRPNMMKGFVHVPAADPNFRPEVARNTLFLSCGDGDYAEIAQLSGVAATEWSWSGVFLDVDLDGYEDLLVANGNTRDVQDADVLEQIALWRDRESPEEGLKRFPSLATRNLAFRNRGDLTFEEVSARWGFDFLGVSSSMALGDLDNDGDLDVVLNNLNAAPTLCRNESLAPRLAIRLRGLPPNTHGIGAKVRIHGGPVTQSQEIICGSRYLSGDDAVRVFAAGQPANHLRIEVNWRSGTRSVFDHARPNCVYEIAESAAVSSTAAQPAPALSPWFNDVTSLLNHAHIDEPFDDFARQPLLPHRLSQLGPGVAWVDYDQDGWDDLLIGTGRGGRLALFKNARNGSFLPTRAFESVVRDQTAVLGWPQSATNVLLMSGSANYEDGATDVSPVRLFQPATGSGTDLVPPQTESAGPLAAGDVDGAGTISLFVGGRVRAGRYPEAVSSHIYNNVDGRFEEDQVNAPVFKDFGLVSGAVFSDLDGDGLPELVLACEWGPIRVFRKRQGRFIEATAELGLEKHAGWWNGVTTGDFDGDGRMDLVASNWGRNTKYQAVLPKPLHLFFTDLGGQQTVATLEAFEDPDSQQVVPWRDKETVANAFPFVHAAFPTYRAYGQASVQQLLAPIWTRDQGPGTKDRGAGSGAVRELQVNTLDSMVFLNRGARFDARPLPVEAQFAPAFGLSVADFDGDGREDLFLAQNFFGVEPETSRYDAGRGLCLRGDGKGGFKSLPGEVSGIKIYGEQRGCAAADYDQDGRVDLVVGENSGTTKLYRNTTAAPGLRVRLKGLPGNLGGIGAVIRLKFGEQFGPAREVHAGSGYWSQDSLTQVLAIPEAPTAVWVRWPGGKQTLTPVKLGSREVEISRDPSRG